MAKLLVLHGPNLNLLGTRGRSLGMLDAIDADLRGARRRPAMR